MQYNVARMNWQNCVTLKKKTKDKDQKKTKKGTESKKSEAPKTYALSENLHDADLFPFPRTYYPIHQPPCLHSILPLRNQYDPQ